MTQIVLKERKKDGGTTADATAVVTPKENGNVNVQLGFSTWKRGPGGTGVGKACLVLYDEKLTVLDKVEAQCNVGGPADAGENKKSDNPTKELTGDPAKKVQAYALFVSVKNRDILDDITKELQKILSNPKKILELVGIAEFAGLPVGIEKILGGAGKILRIK